ncbi:MAG TPA: hypothetical protein VK041_05325 [Opitutales bacterium]|nr:hypothetical protein [Opitutales bacterium]
MAFWILDFRGALGSGFYESIGVATQPCYAGSFESLLDDLFMGAFNHTGANGQVSSQSFWIIKLLLASG